MIEIRVQVPACYDGLAAICKKYKVKIEKITPAGKPYVTARIHSHPIEVSRIRKEWIAQMTSEKPQRPQEFTKAALKPGPEPKRFKVEPGEYGKELSGCATLYETKYGDVIIVAPDIVSLELFCYENLKPFDSAKTKKVRCITISKLP